MSNLIPKAAIELAIEGGWKPRGDSSMRLDSKVIGGWYFRDYESPKSGWIILDSEIALSKDFWVCLGKELGWRKWDAGDEHPTGDAPEAWTHYAIRFCRLILTEQDTTEFWAQLLSAPKPETL